MQYMAVGYSLFHYLLLLIVYHMINNQIIKIGVATLKVNVGGDGKQGIQ